MIVRASDPAHHTFPFLVLMWALMMALMMLPLAWRWVATFGDLSAAAGAAPGGRPDPWRRRLVARASFAGGYGATWLAYSVVVATLQYSVQHTGWWTSRMALSWPAPGLVLLAAGLFQFTPLKQACLRHCRNPLTYFLTRWRNGPPGGFRVGFLHGAYCVGCCWALMATMFAVGVMNVAWMAGVALMMSVEQLVPWGGRVVSGAGAVLMVAGFVLLARG